MDRKDKKSSSVLSGDYTRSTTAENDTQYTSPYACLMVFIAVTVFIYEISMLKFSETYLGLSDD